MEGSNQIITETSKSRSSKGNNLSYYVQKRKHAKVAEYLKESLNDTK